MALLPEKLLRPYSWPDYALFVVVAAFCVFSAKAFTRTPAHSAPAREKFSRGLASVTTEQPVTERSTYTVTLGCPDEKTARAKTSASLLRVTSPGCGHVVRAVNESTGESLLVFERKGSISTHYFPLKAGVNKILIEWKGAKKGTKILEVEKSN
jgi:hypothetical protein